MKEDDGRGCLPVGLGLLLGFVAIEGGIILIASSLHPMLAADGFHPRWVTGAIAGVLILFAGPQLWFLAAGGRKKVGWAQAAAAAPDLALAGYFVLGWAAPQLIGSKAAGTLVGIMVLEFIIIHASVRRRHPGAAFGSIFIPVPRLGATSLSRGEGLWEQHPEQAVMMGALYFALLGFCELYGGFTRVRAADGRMN
ncbi:MAG: hypothetical protein EPO20_14930 [Betaproteobacteria bacterium]|nr:MAG: hypothetical protein EPO20_14930 [Betaproteobacteria bacterium]